MNRALPTFRAMTLRDWADSLRGALLAAREPEPDFTGLKRAEKKLLRDSWHSRTKKAAGEALSLHADLRRVLQGFADMSIGSNPARVILQGIVDSKIELLKIDQLDAAIAKLERVANRLKRRKG